MFLETSAFALRILLAPEQGYFNEKRLIPTSSNLRWKWFQSNDESSEPFHPTPNYNSSILFDCRARATSEYLQKLFLSSNELANGLKLFKIWLEQRQLSSVRRRKEFRSKSRRIARLRVSVRLKVQCPDFSSLICYSPIKSISRCLVTRYFELLWWR